MAQALKDATVEMGVTKEELHKEEEEDAHDTGRGSDANLHTALHFQESKAVRKEAKGARVTSQDKLQKQWKSLQANMKTTESRLEERKIDAEGAEMLPMNIGEKRQNRKESGGGRERGWGDGYTKALPRSLAPHALTKNEIDERDDVVGTKWNEENGFSMPHARHHSKDAHSAYSRQQSAAHNTKEIAHRRARQDEKRRDSSAGGENVHEERMRMRRGKNGGKESKRGGATERRLARERLSASKSVGRDSKSVGRDSSDTRARKRKNTISKKHRKARSATKSKSDDPYRFLGHTNGGPSAKYALTIGSHGTKAVDSNMIPSAKLDLAGTAPYWAADIPSDMPQKQLELKGVYLTYMYICLHVYLYTYTYIHMHICMYIYVYVYVYIYILYTCIFIYAHRHTGTQPSILRP